MFGSAKKTQLVLFIGHHKVGSTSIQDYFSRNAPALAQAGILYPFVDFEGMSYLAAGLAKGPQDTDQLPVNIREPHNALAFRYMATAEDSSVPGYHGKLPPLAQMEHALTQQFMFFDPHTVVMVAEVFSNFSVRSPKMIKRFLKLFDGFDITLLLTLRRIDEYMMSWHGQRLKFGNTVPRLSDGGLDEYCNTIHFDYRLLLQDWMDAAPDAKVVLRDYEDVRAAGGSVVDLIAQAGLKLTEGLQPERRQNDSLHRGIYELARRGNNDLKPQKSGRFRSTLRALVPQMELPPSKDIELLGSDMRARIAEKFAPIDETLGQIAGKGAAFFGDNTAVLETRPLPEADVFADVRDQAITLWPQDGPVSKFKDFLSSLDYVPPRQA